MGDRDTVLDLCEVCHEYPCSCEISEDDYEYGECECCTHCGKPLEEFGDIGCEYCDQRVMEDLHQELQDFAVKVKEGRA